MQPSALPTAEVLAEAADVGDPLTGPDLAGTDLQDDLGAGRRILKALQKLDDLALALVPVVAADAGADRPEVESDSSVSCRT